MSDEINFENTGQVIDPDALLDGADSLYYQPTERDKKLVQFVVDHTDRWRDYRDQNFLKEWERYERIFYGKWHQEDKTRGSERSKIISPATQQAVETAHAEMMEAIFGQGEFFDIKDDLKDENQNPLDVAALKAQLYEDFAQDKIRKSFDQIGLLGKIYGTLIGEIIVEKKIQYYPLRVPMNQSEMAYGSAQRERVSVKLAPVHPKNFIFDPNGTSIDECMGCAIEKETSLHIIKQMITEGSYLNAEIGTDPTDDKLQVTQQDKNFDGEKVKRLTYYGLVPRDLLLGEDDIEDFGFDDTQYDDMVEAIVVIANGDTLLKKQENPYMMKDRPILLCQDDTVPNRLLGRGVVEKAINMQAAIDGSMRAHMDSLALTVAPMIGMDATRLPRGAKFEVKPGNGFMTNGNPSEILFPFKFGTTDGQAMETGKEFERMLLMATNTLDSNGQITQVARDASGIDPAVATMLKKYKRALVNFQEDFLIPFIYKAAWRYMQFDPERYPSVDAKFIPTATLGIIAREMEQKQLAFLIQTLGKDSPLAPILMQSIVKNSSLSNREQMLQQLQQLSQPNPQQQQMMQTAAVVELRDKAASATLKEAQAQKAQVEAQVAPAVAKAKVIAALSNNLDDENEGKDFERRAKIAELALKEKDLEIKATDIASNERIAKAQMATTLATRNRPQ